MGFVCQIKWPILHAQHQIAVNVVQISQPVKAVLVGISCKIMFASLVKSTVKAVLLGLLAQVASVDILLLMDKPMETRNPPKLLHQ